MDQVVQSLSALRLPLSDLQDISTRKLLFDDDEVVESPYGSSVNFSESSYESTVDLTESKQTPLPRTDNDDDEDADYDNAIVSKVMSKKKPSKKKEVEVEQEVPVQKSQVRKAKAVEVSSRTEAPRRTEAPTPVLSKAPVSKSAPAVFKSGPVVSKTVAMFNEQSASDPTPVPRSKKTPVEEAKVRKSKRG
eukprot:TRINITY_DN4038_c0_g4_i1.p1 TRINITY_DN4038_c0_g4~~TRINITY_DN4038_c0_g4_i1.p1  ORF type:complete len:191 (+),score=19.79 TRINITY_DN4038_c0_g4_i1:70-642(+)